MMILGGIEISWFARIPLMLVAIFGNDSLVNNII